MTDRRRLRWFLLGGLLMAALCARAAAEPDSDWPPLPTGKLAFRGVEHCGRFVEENPGWPMDLLTLFVTGKNPDRMWQSPAQHIEWASQPTHSYVADGTGALVVFAHPGPQHFEQICRLDGLTGIEVSTGGNAASREPLWDQVLTWCVQNKRTPLWGFASDDSHSTKDIDRSWLAVRLNRLSEATAKQALRVGNFYISNGPVLRDIQVHGATVTVRLPRPADVRWLRSGQYGIGRPTVSRDAGADRCLKLDAAVTESSYTLSPEDGTTDPKTALFIRFIVTEGRNGAAAQSQPFVLRAADAMDNPYSPEGTWFKGMTHNHSDCLEGSEWKVAEYHAAYEAKGHALAFETGYDYWVTPHVKYPPGRTPAIERVEPMRLASGQACHVTVFGRTFAEGAKVLVDGQPIENAARIPAATEGAADRIEFDAPATLKVGRHEVTVCNPDGLQDTFVNALAVQTSASVNEGWTHYTPANCKLGSKHVYAVTPDPAGGVWVATNYGLSHFDGKVWTLLRRDPRTGEGILADAIYDLAADADGTLWFTCFRGAGRLARDGTLTQWFGPDVGFPSKQVNQILRVGGATCVGTHNRSGLFVLSGDTWRQVPVKIDAPHVGRIHGMAVDGQGRIWMGTTINGLLCWDPAKEQDAWRQFTKDNAGLPDDFVTRVAFDSKGHLWLTTATLTDQPVGGLATLDAEAAKCTVYDPQKSPLPERRCWCLFVDREDNVWVGTSKGAACRRADGAWRIYNVTNSGLGDNLVTDICQDTDGNTWFATANGVSRLAAAKTPDP